MATDDDLKVKQLLDGSAVTEEDLARWFSLPSFQQLAEQPPAKEVVVDEEMQAVIERRERAIAAVDPALVASILGRAEERPETLLQFEARIEVHVDEQFGALDEALLGKAVAEPREVEISDQLRDDLNECTPQALLRDLHRAELDFDKVFELVDVTADTRLDAVAEVRSAMTTRWQYTDPAARTFAEGRALVEELRADRRRPLVDVLPHLTNRRVRE